MTDEADFPRSTKLPTQSPLFWVQQKDRYLRQLLIRDIEASSGRRLITYFANRYEQTADINIGDVSHMMELLGDLNKAPTDLLINTNGGQTDATEALVSLIQASIPDLRVIVPHSAKSNGTMICLAAKTIIMGPPSELGPIDPYLGNTPTSILAEETVKNQNFALHKLALYAIQQSKKLATNLLAEGMMKGKSAEEIDDTVNKLASRKEFFSHGSAIDHIEARKLGLNVTYLEPGDEFWDRIWLFYCMCAHDVVHNGYLKLFEGRARSMAISSIPQSKDQP